MLQESDPSLQQLQIARASARTMYKVVGGLRYRLRYDRKKAQLEELKRKSREANAISRPQELTQTVQSGIETEILLAASEATPIGA